MIPPAMIPGELRQAAQDLMDEYGERIDSDRLEEWLDLFTEDCVYRVMPRENVEQNLPAPLMLCTNKNQLRDRIVALRRANEFNLHYDRHVIGGVRVRPASAAGLWQVEASYAVFQTTLEGQSRLFSVGRYHDTLRAEGGTLLFREKLVVVDSFSIPTLLATPL
jgi:anthranilate 1,2-dioxygenase small subunit